MQSAQQDEPRRFRQVSGPTLALGGEKIMISVQPRPRPAGRSGWVSTNTTSWPAAISAASAVAANSGVPAKQIRIQRSTERTPQADAAEPASPGRQRRPLGGDAAGGAGGANLNA